MLGRFFAVGIALSLAGCVSFSDMNFGSHNVERRVHSTLASSGVTNLHIENVSGAITIESWNKPSVDVKALEYASDSAALDRTHVDVSRNGDRISINTRYSESGGFFQRSSGAQVDYDVHVPAALSVTVVNVSGRTTLSGIEGDVEASEVSGHLDATLGRVAGSRRIHMTAVSGPIVARVARNSDSRVDASTLSGDVHLFFPADIHHGYVGNSAIGSIGKGAASIVLHTLSGSINVEPM
ncbi:MAG TPA: DUF4097 family beta strand repeat-containing protein [Candidatus Rubrimentiphilum sp.]|nr:DUF4097 family beta strand repeat-containing protein [Candidatus Rubrimentiphilum sp.]